MNIEDILNLVDENPVNYGLYHQESCTPGDSSPLINVVIGVRGRSQFLSLCLQYLKTAALVSKLPITFLVVEQDNEMQHKDLCWGMNIPYLFASNSTIHHGHQYNRSFCFNLGFITASPSYWYLFHDVDMLVEPDFFIKLNEYIQKYPLWLQPYTKKRVILLKEDATNKLCQGEYNLSGLVIDKDYKTADPGSTGGSILVRRDAFIDVGGFDPELFYGYGPEDSFFWSKLESLEKEVGDMSYHFAGGGLFADDPSIEIYHMYHVSMQSTNTYLDFMRNIRETFWHSSYADKLRILSKKKEVLKKFL